MIPKSGSRFPACAKHSSCSSCRVITSAGEARSDTIMRNQNHLAVKITLSSEGWIDVVQDGKRLASITSTGATGCAGVRKSVKFQLGAAPLTVQFSGIDTNSVGVAISAE